MVAGLPPSAARATPPRSAGPGIALVAGAKLPLAFIGLGLGAFALATSTLAVRCPAPDESAFTFAATYGVALIVGALSFMILGLLCKIIPFLVWMNVYGPRAGRQPVPQATALGSRGLEHAWIVSHGIGVATALGAVLTRLHALAAISAAVLAVSGLIFLSNVARILRHLFRPESPVVARLGKAAMSA